MSRQILKSTALFSIFVLLAQVLGLVRDLYLVRFFGVGPVLDTYYLAFKIPDFLNVFYSVFLGSVIFIPLLTKAKNKKHPQPLFQKEGGSAQEHSETNNVSEIIKKVNSVGSLVLTLLIIFFFIIFVFMNFFVSLLVPTWTETQKELLVNLSRILLVAQLFFPIGIVAGAIGMMYERPLGMALSGFVYNLTILLFAIILVPIFGIYGLAYSVVIAAMCFMLVQVSNKYVWQIYKNFNYIINYSIILEWAEFIKENLGRFFAVAAFQFYGLLLLFIAGLAGTGAISSFSIAYNLYLAAFFVLGASFSTALMPKISEHFVKGESDSLKENLRKSIFYIFLISLAASIFLFFASNLIVKILYYYSNLTLEKEKYIATLLSLLAFSLPFFNVLEVIRKYLYATAQIFWAGSLTVFILLSTSILVYFFTFYSFPLLPHLEILFSLIWAMNISIVLATILILFVLKLKRQI